MTLTLHATYSIKLLNEAFFSGIPLIEFQASGLVTQKCDVYAFGVVVVELLLGKEVLKYVFDEGKGLAN